MGRRTRIAAITAATLTTLGLAAPAGATMTINDRYSGAFSETFSECGLDAIDADHEFRGLFTARLVKSSNGQAWLGHNKYFGVDVFTNPDNGRTFTLRFNGNFREIKAQQVDGDVWRFFWKDSGASFALYDGDGNLVWRDRGTVSGVDLFDTLGDGQVGGEFISSDITALHGKFKELDWCSDIVVPYLG